jgi:hypothetical protein
LREYGRAIAHMHIACDEPVAKHTMISMCVTPAGEPDFEIVDDSLEVAAVFEPERLLAIARTLESAR